MNLRFKPNSHLKHWFKNFKRVATNCIQISREAQLWNTSASLAFTTLLSIVPILALSFAVFKSIGGTDILYETLEPFLIQNLATKANAQAMGILKEIVDRVQLKTVGLGGFIALLFTSMTMLAAAEKAIHRIWETPNRRPVFNRLSAYWLIVTLGPLLLSVVLGFAASHRAEFHGWIPTGLGLFLLTFGTFFFVYRWVPDTDVHAGEAAIAAGVATILFHGARSFFPWYTREVLTLDSIYGGVAAVPLLMLWIQILWLIVLWGVALNRAMQK